MHPEPAPLSNFDQPKLEALVEMMVLAASADGEFQPEEREKLCSSILSLTSRHIEEDRLPSLLETLEARIQKEGREARLAAVAEALGELGTRRVALDLALQVMVADGILRTSERELIREITDAFGLSADEAADRIKSLLG